jgi:hypothetical protein
MMNKNTVKQSAIAVAIAVGFALMIRGIYGIDGLKSLFMVMSITFLIALPFGVGALTIYFSPVEKVKSWLYRIFMPWVPITIFFLITFMFAIEGWACWAMVSPLFLIASTIGGVIAGGFKLRKAKRENLYISFIALLPLLLSPAERLIGNIPGQYKAYTYTDIKAPKEAIWANVTRVKEINAAQDKGWLTRELGFPRPLRAELNYERAGIS